MSRQRTVNYMKEISDSNSLDATDVEAAKVLIQQNILIACQCCTLVISLKFVLVC